ncbi:hypothetical protein PUR29_34460 [Methylobacterium ajmalii]|uniref:Putative tail fiber protein gp53-like C-terminal domain-containing protein n=1 Tax=Methylobacterium ajmalii TaxID=2738439 RepID=A0ABV0A579_9HYPH
MSSLYNLPPELDISKDETFSKDRLDQAFAYIVQRLLLLDSFRPSWEEQLSLFQTIGLTRLDDALRPVYEDLVSITQLGVMFTASSKTATVLGSGLKTFTISDADKTRFAAAGYLSIQDVGIPEHTMFGLLQSYDRTTGQLSILVDQFVGEEGATAANWRISAAASPNVLTTAHQVGAYTQGEVDALITALRGTVNDILTSKANRVSPQFTGTPTAPTVNNGSATGDQIATLGFVQLIAAGTDANIRSGAPTYLNTLAKIAQALGNDPNLAANLYSSLASKVAITAQSLSEEQKAQARQNISAQQNLGFMPVQQAGGSNQNSNKIFLGWGTDANLRCQVDAYDLGKVWTDAGSNSVFPTSFNNPGYLKMPQGLIIQWGATEIVLDGNALAVIGYPTAFPNGQLFTFLPTNGENRANNGYPIAQEPRADRTIIAIPGQGPGARMWVNWIAIGR